MTEEEFNKAPRKLNREQRRYLSKHSKNIVKGSLK